MFTRIATVFLAAVLAIPTIPLTRQDEAGSPPWGSAIVAAKGKPHHGHKHTKNKKHEQPAQLPPGTHTERQSVTKTFTSTGRIAVPDDSGMNATGAGKAGPYPSTLDVSGFANGAITDVNLTLTGFTHTSPADSDVLLSENNDRQALVMSDVSDGTKAANINLTLDDEAATLIPANAPLQSGTFRPTNSEDFVDTFDAPAPAFDGTVALRTFDGSDPNGTWQLWVMDNAGGDVGEFAGGWALVITADVDVQVQDQISQPRQDKKHHLRNVSPASAGPSDSRRRP
jgi:hypothetical protein